MLMLKGKGISFLIPRSPGIDASRDRLWEWLREYWMYHLPKVQMIGGRDPNHLSRPGRTFSKTTAVNNAAAQATGDIFVLIDSDAYVDPAIILTAANEIRRSRERGRKLWFVPYRRFYRINTDLTEDILSSDPRQPQNLTDPFPAELCDPVHGNAPNVAHHYGAMIMVFPREAFEELGGMDERFVGWGGEDISFMRALDTVYNTHKTLDRAVYHLHHDTIGTGVNRQWIGQVKASPFTVLGARYQAAYGDRARMLNLNDEWRNGMRKVHPNLSEDSLLNPDVMPEPQMVDLDHSPMLPPLESIDLHPTTQQVETEKEEKEEEGHDA